MDFSKYKIKESGGTIETNEIFLDTLAKKKEEEMGLTEKRFEVKIKEKLIYFIFAIFLLIAAVLFSKTFYLQVFQGKQLYNLSQNNKGKISLIVPERGIIYDSNLKKLVWNSPAYNVICDIKNFYTNKDNYIQEIRNISGVLGVDSAEIENELNFSDNLTVEIASGLDQEKLISLEPKMKDFPDCQIENNTERNYVMGSVFSHVLGYVGRINKSELQDVENYTPDDTIGKDGLEKFYEPYLRGIPGRTEVTKDATGIKRGDKVLSEPTSGDSLVLNIDSNLQKVVYDSLEKSIKNIGAKKGAAVALNPKTGAVLALVSYPAYDDNLFSGGISYKDYNNLINDSSQPLFNRAIASKYPTGSTIKPFLAAGALQENLISPDKIINDPGYILVHSQYDPSITYKFSGVTPHGLVDMRKALAVSSNIYFFTIGGGYGDQKGLGPGRIKKYLDLFGWEQKTGIDLPGEFAGFVPTPTWKKAYKNEPWWDGDTYNLSIGQSDLQVTPLQVAVAYCAIANGGTLYQPQIVQKIISSDQKETTKEFAPQILNTNFINPEFLQIVREGMRDGVEKDYGGSHMLNDIPVAVAGKTGTAETNRAGYFNTWSANFAPYDDPEIVFVTTIEGVNGLRSATLPVAHDVLQWYFSEK